MGNPVQIVRGKRRKFLLLIINGLSPEDACRQAFPQVRGVAEHVAKTMSDPKFSAAYSYLLAHRYSKEVILQKTIALASDPGIKTVERVNALKLASHLAGHILFGERHTAKAKKTETKRDDTLLNRMVELARKVEDGKSTAH